VIVYPTYFCLKVIKLDIVIVGMSIDTYAMEKCRIILDVIVKFFVGNLQMLDSCSMSACCLHLKGYVSLFF